jgi:hypothetical protein
MSPTPVVLDTVAAVTKVISHHNISLSERSIANGIYGTVVYNVATHTLYNTYAILFFRSTMYGQYFKASASITATASFAVQ